jgi:hypothetical protein
VLRRPVSQMGSPYSPRRRRGVDRTHTAGRGNDRTIKDATFKRSFYETHDQLRTDLRDFVDANNVARRLKTIRRLAPYEFILQSLDCGPKQIQD